MILVYRALMAQRTVEQNVDIPVPRPDGAGDLQRFPRGQGSTAFSEQIPVVPDPRGGRDFQPVQAPQRLLRILLDNLTKGFFALFT